MSLAGDDRLNDLESLQESTWGIHSMNADVATAAAAISEPPPKSHAQAELQLRYLLQLFTEADCLDWALVLAMILRDAMAVLRLVSLARSALNGCQPQNQAVTIEIVTRLRDGLLALSHWAEIDCQGYKPFMNVIYGQVGILTKLILPQNNGPPAVEGSSEPVHTIAAPVKSRHTSVSLLTPLSRVTEEEVSVTQINGKLEVPSENALPQLHQSSTTKKEQPLKQQDESPQPQQGSSCVIS